MLLRVESLDVSIKAVRILRGVELAVEKGQLAGLIGRNGAGKTTLLRTLAGVLEPAVGSIRLDGQELDGVPPHRRARMGIGWMPRTGASSRS